MNTEIEVGDVVELKEEYSPKHQGDTVRIPNCLDGSFNVRRIKGKLLELSKVDERGVRVLNEKSQWEISSDIPEVKKVKLRDDIEIEIVKKRPPVVLYSSRYFNKLAKREPAKA